MSPKIIVKSNCFISIKPLVIAISYACQNLLVCSEVQLNLLLPKRSQFHLLNELCGKGKSVSAARTIKTIEPLSDGNQMNCMCLVMALL